MPRVVKYKGKSKLLSQREQIARASYGYSRAGLNRKRKTDRYFKSGKRRLTKKEAKRRVARGKGFGSVKYAKTQRETRKKLLAAQLRQKAIEKSLKNLRKKVNKQEVPENVVIYRDFTGFPQGFRGDDTADNTLFNRREGQLVLEGNTPTGMGIISTRAKNGRPVYHMQSWSGHCLPGELVVPDQAKGSTDEGEIFCPATWPVQVVDQYTEEEVRSFQYNRLDAPLPYNWHEHSLQSSLMGYANVDNHIAGKSLRIDGFSAFEHNNIIPQVFPEDLIGWEDLVDMDSKGSDEAGWMREMFQQLPRRKGDSIKVVNNYMKFDFYNYSDGYVAQASIAEGGDTVVQIPTLDPGAPASGPAFANYVPQIIQKPSRANNYAQARIIIGYRTKKSGAFHQKFADRIRLRDLFRDESDTGDYSIGRTNEEFVNDHFNRKIVLKDKDGNDYWKMSSSATHTSNVDRPTLDDTTVMVDETIKLGEGHTVKTYNCMKGHTLKYEGDHTTDPKRFGADQVAATWGPSDIEYMIRNAGMHHTSYGTAAELNHQPKVAPSSWATMIQQSSHATNRQYFCFVIMRTRGRRVRYRFGQKFEFSP